MKKLPKTLVLDYKKWRCGGDFYTKQDNGHGKGWTELLNREGHMCCLGQFLTQTKIDKGDYSPE